MDSIKFEVVGILLQLLSDGDVGSGELVHGFHLDIVTTERLFEISYEVVECSKGLGSKLLLSVYFGPGSSQSLFHIGEGIGDLPVIAVV